jgi:hypothetical protein
MSGIKGIRTRRESYAVMGGALIIIASGAIFFSDYWNDKRRS